jgi:NMD protein affecting ribosome stability and mRNA decay
VTHSEKEVLRQRERKKAGLCVRCGVKRQKSKEFCDECLVKRRLLIREKLGLNSWFPSGPGRSPMVKEKV